jgi:hypothetical protein
VIEHYADRCQPFENYADSLDLPGIAVPQTSEMERSVDTALATAPVPLFVPKTSQTIVTDEKMTKEAADAVAAKEQSFAATDAMEFEGHAGQLEDLAAIAQQRGVVGGRSFHRIEMVLEMVLEMLLCIVGCCGGRGWVSVELARHAPKSGGECARRRSAREGGVRLLGQDLIVAVLSPKVIFNCAHHTSRAML